MRHKNYFISLLLLLAALTASAQTCPGPANRTALINLQKSQIVNGTRWGQTVLTDTCGNQRYVTLDSIIVIIVDSIAADTTLQRNWYTHNGVTTDLGRFAYVKRTAWWLGLDSVGFLRHTMRPDLFNGTQSTLFQDSFVVEYTNDAAVRNYISLADTGVVIATTGDEPRSVNVRTDTVNWSSSVAISNFRINFLSDESYERVDLTEDRVWFLGLFDDFNNGFAFNFDESDSPEMWNGDGIDGSVSFGVYQNNTFRLESKENTIGTNQSFFYNIFEDDGSSYILNIDAPSPSKWIEFAGTLVGEVFNVTLPNMTMDDDSVRINLNLYVGDSWYSTLSGPKTTNLTTRSFGVFSELNEIVNYHHFDVSAHIDTALNRISFYNFAYEFANEHPIGAAGDTLFHFWAATGPGGEAGKDPGFMTLDAICAHCSESAVNWYNSNGTTTDNTRIANVTETATWLSDDVTVDGVFPFRFELAGGVPNEPELMVWKFPADSATLYQSDQELVLHSTNQWVFRSDEQTRIWADSFSYSNGSSGGFAVTQYNRITQSSVSNGDKQDLLENRTITGTAQAELFLDGSSAVLTLPANRNNNFEIHVSAICSDAGNGVGITTGDAYTSWHVGGIKRVVNTTSLVGTVQTTATAQSDASMSTSVVTIDADDTDDSLRIRFTPPSTAGSTTVLRVLATIQLSQIGY